MNDERGTSSLSLRTCERIFETKRINSTAEQISLAEIAAVDYVNRNVLSLHQYEFQNCRESIAERRLPTSGAPTIVISPHPVFVGVFVDEICTAQK